MTRGRTSAEAWRTQDGPALARHIRRLRTVNGWLMWGLVLPVLLVVAGIITVRRRKQRR
jgi:hypothetical protein